MKRVLVEKGAIAPRLIGEDDVRVRMAELHGNGSAEIFHRPRFGRFLRQAQDAALIDLTKTPKGYELALKEAPDPGAAEPPVEDEGKGRGRGRGRGRRGTGREDKGVAPEVAAPPAEPAAEPAAAAPAPPPKRFGRQRYGSKGPSLGAQIPLVGVVEMDEAPAAPAAKPRRGRGGPAAKKAPAGKAGARRSRKPRDKGGAAEG